MRTNDSYSPRSKRGPRRRRSGGSPADRKRPAPKPTFWQKLVAFFKGDKKSTPVRSGYGSTPGVTREKREEQPRRKPEIIEVNSPKLYVGNLSFDATEGDLFELFKGVGNVQNAEIVSHKHTQKSKGFGFVTMQSVEEARRAVQELHDKDFMSRKLVVSGAKTSDVPRPSSVVE